MFVDLRILAAGNGGGNSAVHFGNGLFQAEREMFF
jgi:hypothetical protein